MVVVEEPILADGMNRKGGGGLPRKIETGAGYRRRGDGPLTQRRVFKEGGTQIKETPKVRSLLIMYFRILG